MHACGDDAHARILLGVAKYYADSKAKPPVYLRFIFQPAEELGTGAAELIKPKVLDGVDVILGLHCDPTREWGMVRLTEGTWSAFLIGFKVELTGVASHGGVAPEKGKDSILAAAYLTIADTIYSFTNGRVPGNSTTVRCLAFHLAFHR